MKTKIKYGWLLCLLVFSACNSWIDITPSDRLNEDMLFEDRQGFEKAINGVYVGLVDRSALINMRSRMSKMYFRLSGKRLMR